jgi:small-conductance mechanosensitive channel
MPAAALPAALPAGWFSLAVDALFWTVVAGLVGALVGAVLDVVGARALRRWAHRSGHTVVEATDLSMRGLLEVWGALIAMAIVRPRPGMLPPGWEAALDRLWVAAAILSVTYFAARLALALIRGYTRSDKGGATSGSSIVANITRTAIWAVGLTFVLSALGVQVGPLVAALGVTGIAVSLGLQGILANLFNGLQILMTRQFEPGQYVKLQSGDEGIVTDITWRDTQIRTPNGDLVIVPNSVLGNTAMRNYSRGAELYILAIPFSVRRDSDLDAVVDLGERIARELASMESEADAAYEPSCGITVLGDTTATCQTLIGIRHFRKRGAVTDEYLRMLERALKAEAVATAAD